MNIIKNAERTMQIEDRQCDEISKVTTDYYLHKLDIYPIPYGTLEDLYNFDEDRKKKSYKSKSRKPIKKIIKKVVKKCRCKK